MTSFLVSVRKLRHGPLRRWGPLWTVLGNLYRGWLRLWRVDATIPIRVGPYGPFLMDARFAFSNFERWGTGHNACFRASVAASTGADCVFDVGAHIGLVSLPISKVLAPGGKIYSFEPAAANRALLLRHIEANQIKNIEVVGKLVGDQDREGIEFFEERKDSGLNSVAAETRSGVFHKTYVDQICLDGFSSRFGLRPQVIKIDVEGAELGVLEGAAATIRVCRPLIFLSVHPAQIERLGRTMAELSALIADLGYEVRDGESGPVGEILSGEFMLVPAKIEVETHDA